jgi:hypothetical protein
MPDNKEEMKEEQQNCDTVFDDHRFERWVDQAIEKDAKDFGDALADRKNSKSAEELCDPDDLEEGPLDETYFELAELHGHL